MGKRILTFMVTLSALGASSQTLTLLPAHALGEAEYALGVDAYKKKDFKKAAEQFRSSIQKGNKAAAAWLYAAHTFNAQGQFLQAFQTYEIITKTFKDSPEAAIATQGMESLRGKPGVPAAAGALAAPPVAADAAKAAPGAPGAPPAADVPVGLAARINVFPPQNRHPAVGAATIKAVRDAVNAIPNPMRKKLDDSGAYIDVAPNILDIWPDTINELVEDKDEPTLAEQGGHIYGKRICIYERAKARGANTLKEARSPKLIRQTVLNCCFQIIDDAESVSKDPALRKVFDAEKNGVPAAYTEKLATFLKEDDWGARETCSELTGSILGGSDENTDDLNRFFPRTRLFLKAKLGI